MSGIDIALRLLGAFYMFAGVVVVRAFAMSRFLDDALDRLGGVKPGRAEAARAAWNVATALLTFAGGVSLLLLSDLAPRLFLASLAWQALYLGWIAPRVLDPSDPPDASGRQQSVNALVIYSAATGWVVWAWWQGRLIPWQELPQWALLLGLAAVAGLAAYVAWIALRPAVQGGGGKIEEPKFDLARVRRIKVMAEVDSQPLWVMDDGQHFDVAPSELGLSAELSRDFAAWGEAYTACFEGDDEARKDECHRRHAAAGRELALRLARERPEIEVLALDPVAGVVPVRPGDPAGAA